MPIQLIACELHKELLVAIQKSLRGFILHTEFLAHFVVEMLQQLAACLRHSFVNFEAEFELELVECGPDFLRLAATLIDGSDALFEVHARLDGASHFIARAEHP